MSKNYLKITWRNVLKHKGYSLINILGLSVGMTVCILIFLWVQDELSFDRFHKNADRICRITKEIAAGSERQFMAITPWPLGAALEQNFPEVTKYARFRKMGRALMSYKDKRFFESGLCVADPSFLEIFTFPLVKGDPATALEKVRSVVITEELAEKYFGDEEPLGKILNYSNSIDMVVTGVLKNIPRNSHIKFDLLIPLEPSLKDTAWYMNWEINDFHTFVLLEKNVSLKNFREKIYNYLLRLFPETQSKLIAQPLTEMHLHSNYIIDLHGASTETAVYIYIFSLIAVIILLIACINFVNLTVAKASTRTIEVGIRKVAGASRKDLITQFFGESILLTIISFIFAIILVYLLLPIFNNLADKTLTLNPFSNIVIGPVLLLIAIITGIISGLYPAFIQSSFQPANVIKGNFILAAGKPQSSLFRKVLVILQFTCSVALIICTLTVNEQLSYIQDKDLGYDKDNVMYFRRIGEINQKYQTFKEVLLENPDIVSVTTSSDVPKFTVHGTGGFQWEGKSPDYHLLSYHFSVDHDYIKTFNMKIIDGRNFSKEFADAPFTAYIVNETAVKAMGLKNPVGTKFTFWNYNGSIIGVVKDFHFKSLHTKVEPLILRLDPKTDWIVFVKLKQGRTADALNYIKKIHQQFSPDYPLEYYFLDEEIDRLYDDDVKTSGIFRYFTIIAILISCLGLFGLASFMAQRRFKEIGIRKVLGATTSNIVAKLTKEFLLLVLVANILAWPIAYLAMDKWLQSFVYRANMSIGTFIIAALLALVIAAGTVIFQSIKAATANPVDAIHYE